MAFRDRDTLGERERNETQAAMDDHKHQATKQRAIAFKSTLIHLDPVNVSAGDTPGQVILSRLTEFFGACFETNKLRQTCSPSSSGL